LGIGNWELGIPNSQHPIPKIDRFGVKFGPFPARGRFLFFVKTKDLTGSPAVFPFLRENFAMEKAAVSFQIWLLVSVFAAPLIAQQAPPDTLITNELQPVTVTAYRLETTDLATPLSITTIGKNQLQNGTQQLALDEALMGVPGVFVQKGRPLAFEESKYWWMAFLKARPTARRK
jgi:hypothetical protein